MTYLADVDAPATFVEYLAREGLISSVEVQQLQSLQQDKESSPLAIALRAGLLPEAVISQAFSRFTGWSLADVAEMRSHAQDMREAFQSLNLQMGWCHDQGIAIWETQQALVCCTRDLLSPPVREVLRVKSIAVGKPLLFMACRAVDLDEVYASLELDHNRVVMSSGDLAYLRELAEEGPIVELVNSLLSQAVDRRASDIHIEPADGSFCARVRVDGVMRELQTFSIDKFDATVCRIKILSQLDIAERRMPQDGRMTARVHGEIFDVRISILPGVHGESVVLRLLRQERPSYQLGDLGMLADHAAMFRRWIGAADGIVLITGPTGSGKTTTLYTALDLGNDGLKKIITVEDPVEYKLKGITQLQANSDIGYTFATALRSILRHDPDVILIGEIRDQETAGIAVQAALTGHLVFSTLHTNSAAGAITRLADMGIERFLLASSLRGIMAQRLVRCLCPHCSRPVAQLDAPIIQMVEEAAKAYVAASIENTLPPARYMEAVGCDRCMHTGYLGRVAVYELFDVDERIVQKIVAGDGEQDVIRHLRAMGVRSMTQDGLLKVWQGITTTSEVLNIGG